MTEERYILIRDFCAGHSLEERFLYQLRDYELIRIVEVGDQPAVPQEELGRLERMVRLYRDLELGPENLQVVEHLLTRMERLQEEILELRRRLGRWE